MEGICKSSHIYTSYCVHACVLYYYLYYIPWYIDKNNKKATNNKRNQVNDCREEELSNSIVDCLLDINKLINGSDKRVKMVRENKYENDFKVTSCVRIPMSKGIAS